MKEGGPGELGNKKEKKKTSPFRAAFLTAMTAFTAPGDPAEAAENTIDTASKAEYMQARASLDATKGKKFFLEYDVNGEIINIGVIGEPANLNPENIQEDALLPVLSDFGFSSATEFADAFNGAFEHRSERARKMLSEGAIYFDQMIASGKDIPDSDEKFVNLRLAVGIWAGLKKIRGVGDSNTENVTRDSTGTLDESIVKTYTDEELMDIVESGNPRGYEGVHVPESASSHAEQASKADYVRARSHMSEAQKANPHNLPSLEYYVAATGEIIDIAYLNTRTDTAVTEEDGILDILADLGFQSPDAVEKFAEEFNKKFKNARDREREEGLTRDAAVVGESLRTRETISIEGANVVASSVMLKQRFLFL